MRKRAALWGHDFVPSGEMVRYLSIEPREPVESCRKCRWPADEHPDHPSRYPNPRIFIDGAGREVYFAGRPAELRKLIAQGKIDAQSYVD